MLIKSFPFLLFALLSTHVLMSQTKSDKVFKTFKFGLYTGPTFNSMKPVTSESENYLVSKVKGNTGFSLGFCADYNINERYVLYTGVSLDWRGGTISTTHDTTPVKSTYLYSSVVKYKLQYLTVPLGLKMTAAQIDNIKVFVQTGIDVGFLLSQKGDYTTVPANGLNPESKTNIKLGGVASSVPVNAGWMLGAGIEYDINGKNAVFLSVLYRNGFTDITIPQNNKDGYKYSDGNIRSNTVALRVGYFF